LNIQIYNFLPTIRFSAELNYPWQFIFFTELTAKHDHFHNPVMLFLLKG
jgi:hypothetical protein